MKIYCSGIGGIGLSAYAAQQAARGHAVLGSDRSESPLLDDLRAQGITVFLSQDATYVTSDIDLFVYSEAIPVDCPERQAATRLGIRSLSYFQALGELVKGSMVIAVCGTHGKSSTTAMVAKVLLDAGKDPSVVVGTKMKELHGRNWRKGESNVFVVEACEYRRSFLSIQPSMILMTNVDGDHFDAYATLVDYRRAFVDFLSQLPPDGAVIAHGKDPDSVEVVRVSGKDMIDADEYADVSLSTPGAHMRQNARLVRAMGRVLSLDDALVTRSLAAFSGTWRRMEVKGAASTGAIVVDDYGHHPVEIRATLAAMREAYPERRILCVFQPHTHDRTIKLYADFVRCFSDADVVVIPNIYVARSDIETRTVDVDSFVRDIAASSHVEAVHGHGMADTERYLRDRMQPQDVIVTMGAGDISQLSETLLRT